MSVTKSVRVAAASFFLLGLTACGVVALAHNAPATSPTTAPAKDAPVKSAPAQEMAPCPACGMKLVAVTDATPRSAYHGKSYFFANLRCKEAFDKNPEKYAAKVAAWEKSQGAPKKAATQPTAR